MRIIAGEWRGRPIGAPSGQATRPTADRAREGLFSMLRSRVGSFGELGIADLFAGSGALGLEALSRGAAHCLFVDNDREAIATIRRNLDTLGATARADVRSQSVEHMPRPARAMDIMFMDPPYASGLAEAALQRAASDNWLAPGGFLSLETSGSAPPLPDAFSIEAERRFGKAHLLLLRRRLD